MYDITYLFAIVLDHLLKTIELSRDNACFVPKKLTGIDKQRELILQENWF